MNWWSGRTVQHKEILEEDGKDEKNTIIMGDWNSVVGDESYWNIVGPHGLGRRNQRGQMLIDFGERYGLVSTNTSFKKPKWRVYTLKAPGYQSQHQLDYMLVKHRFRNRMKDLQTVPGEDTDYDYNLLAVKICMRLKMIIKFPKGKPKWGLEKLYAQWQKCKIL